MQSLSLHSPQNPWLTRLVTFLLAALVAASVGYWVLKWPTQPTATRLPVAEPAAPVIDPAKVALLLGAQPDTSAADAPAPALNIQSKYKLLGVIAQGGQRGSALIAIEGQPAKPYRVGDALADNLVLQAVKARSATLATDLRSPTGVTLELPALPGAP